MRLSGVLGVQEKEKRERVLIPAQSLSSSRALSQWQHSTSSEPNPDQSAGIRQRNQAAPSPARPGVLSAASARGGAQSSIGPSVGAWPQLRPTFLPTTPTHTQDKIGFAPWCSKLFSEQAWSRFVYTLPLAGFESGRAGLLRGRGLGGRGWRLTAPSVPESS